MRLAGWSGLAQLPGVASDPVGEAVCLLCVVASLDRPAFLIYLFIYFGPDSLNHVAEK